MELKTRFCNEGMMVAGVGRCLQLGLRLQTATSIERVLRSGDETRQ